MIRHTETALPIVVGGGSGSWIAKERHQALCFICEKRLDSGYLITARLVSLNVNTRYGYRMNVISGSHAI
ncbi:hypothetical protein AERO9A_210088 [Aeromonas salmonicida]|nr:hypothetical protein AERO9A_210088 [Aeromonas salmonicida]